MPRPTPSTDEWIRGYRLQIRLDDAEKAALDAAAESSGQGTSTWARTVLLAEAARRAASSGRRESRAKGVRAK